MDATIPKVKKGKWRYLVKILLISRFFFFSLGAPLCVLFRPKVIATAALLLATHLSSEELPENWWEIAHVDIGEAHGRYTRLACATQRFSEHNIVTRQN